MIVQRLEAPLSQVVDLDALRRHVRTDPGDGDIDQELDLMAHAAVREAEDFAQIALRSQAIRVTLEAWPGDPLFRLPIGPLTSEDRLSVEIDGQPFETFAVLTGLRPALRLDRTPPAGRVVIEYLAGWGEHAASIPEDLHLAVLDQAAAFFDARGPGDGKTVARSPHFTRIVGRYRKVRL